MKHKKLVWLLMIFMLAAAGTGALYLWQRENIKAIADADKYTSEEIEEQLIDNRESVNEIIEENKDISVRDLNDDEKEALKDGTVTEEELIDILTQPEKVEPSAETEGQKTETDVTEISEEERKKQEYQQALAELVAEVYIMRQEYTDTLDGMAAQAKAEYLEKSESEKTTAKLMKWAAGYITRANELEKQCDERMDTIVGKMTALIEENDGDMTLVNTVVYTYAQEKSLKKSWYLSEMKERGLV